MKTLVVDSVDPHFNLALEEYLLKEYPLDEDVFFVWKSNTSVVIGRNQNPFNEIDLSYCYENHIPVLRRISGGGTVVHDLGNINFTYITHGLKQLNNYEYFLKPIILLINQLGIELDFRPKSHVYYKKSKVSGNAQTYHKERMLHHGTILYDMDLEVARNVLKRKGIEGRYVSSVPADICNIKSILPVKTTVDEFMRYIQEGILHHIPTDKMIELTIQDIKRVNEIKIEKYLSYDWLYGGTTYSFKNEILSIDVHNGMVVQSSINQIIGKQLDYQTIKESLDDLPNKEDILKNIF